MTAAFATEPTIDYGHVELVPVYFDDLDPIGMVHNARYALLVERALATFWRQHGHNFRDGRPTTPDAFNVVKEFSISYRAPIAGIGEVRVHFWLEHLGSSCAVYAYRLLSSDGATVYADGRRVIVKLDPETLRPSPWTPEVRAIADGPTSATACAARGRCGCFPRRPVEHRRGDCRLRGRCHLRRLRQQQHP